MSKMTIDSVAEAELAQDGQWVIDEDGKAWCLIDTHMGFPQRMAMDKRLLMNLENLAYPLHLADFEGDCEHRWGNHELGHCVRCGQVVGVPMPTTFDASQMELFREVAEMNARAERLRESGGSENG